jgi:Protein of unknown function (DUF3306)
MHAMTPEDTKAPERFSLSRWSRRKREAARGVPETAAPAMPAAAQAPVAVASADAAVAGTQVDTTRPASDAPAIAEALPPVDSLNFDSDFAAFMQPKVDEGTKRAALKKLFSNEHFNVMDGLDIYVGDYTQPDPMPEGMLEKLANVYEAIKPFDNEPAAAEAALAQVAPEAAPVDATASQPVAAEPAPDAALPAADAPELPPPVLDSDELAPGVDVQVPIAPPKSA